jgi:3-methyladenine DNA glycosylase/8-oxoguanine DNA glycosylase
VPSSLVDLPALRAFLVAHAVPGLDDVEALEGGGTRHRRLVPVGGAHLELRVVLPPERLGTPLLEVDGPADAVPRGHAAGRRWVGLDADPASAAAALATDPVLGALVRARPHLRVPGSTDGFETAVLVVLGQHVSLAAGRVFAARLVAAHGLRGRHARLRAFPTPEALASVDPDALRHAVGVTGARARTVVALARAVAEGALVLDRRVAGAATARASLLAVPGVGPWTADLVALRALRDPDVFLPGDLVLRKALGGVTARAAATASQAWRPHRSLAVLHLWTHQALDPPPAGPPR